MPSNLDIFSFFNRIKSIERMIHYEYIDVLRKLRDLNEKCYDYNFFYYMQNSLIKMFMKYMSNISE